MDVGTAKATTAERAAVAHHGLDLVDPAERYSAGRFARDAHRWIEEIRARGRVPVLAGGTGFFLRALLQPLFDEPPMEPAARARLQAYLATLPDARLSAWVAVLDPERGARVRDRQRLGRILEVALLTGRRLSWWHAHAPPAEPAVEPVIIVLELPRAELYARIDRRVERLLENGLVEEVRGLLAKGCGPEHPGMNATGYIELIPYLQGDRSLDEAKTLIQNATRAYARRQLTWLRNQLPADAVRLDATGTAAELAERIVGEWRRRQRA
jgi:tRNA dimethylallyltransferase